LLALVALANLAERVKERSRQGEAGQLGRQLELKPANLTHIKHLAATCFKGLDLGEDDGFDPCIRDATNGVSEFMLHVEIVIIHNTLMSRIDLEGDLEGCERPALGAMETEISEDPQASAETLESVGALSRRETLDRQDSKAVSEAGSVSRAPSVCDGAESVAPSQALSMVSKKSAKSTQHLVIPDFRSQFRSIRHMQRRSNSVIRLVEQCLRAGTCAHLTTSAVEMLCALTYLAPLSVSDLVNSFELVKQRHDWSQASLTCLFANSLAESTRGEAELRFLEKAESDFIFPLLTSSDMETRRNMMGALANLGTHLQLFDFVLGTGVLRIFSRFPSRVIFLEHFAMTIEGVRLLSNWTSYVSTHKTANSDEVIGFLGDVLRHCSELLLVGNRSAGAGDQLAASSSRRDPQRREDRGEKEEHSENEGSQENEDDKSPPLYDFIESSFVEGEEPLGLKIRWEQPGRVTGIVPGTFAAQREGEIAVGDELMEVNDVDVSEMAHTDVQNLLQVRPLRIVFRRARPVDISREETPSAASSNIAQQLHVGNVATYGNKDRYLECLQLALVTLHNLATSIEVHPKLLSEGTILRFLLELIPSDVLSPRLRRLVFSTLTCLCQQEEWAGRIFKQMTLYFAQCADPALQKYVLKAANLYYTSTDTRLIEPDPSTFLFVSNLSHKEDLAGNFSAVAEILHRMSLAPVEMRRKFISRETLVVVSKFIAAHGQYGFQIRAFEAAYFLTLGALDPKLWSSVDLLPTLIKAAAAYRNWKEPDEDLAFGLGCEFNTAEEAHQGREDALWELALRTSALCLPYDVLVRQIGIPEFDRYMMDILDLGGAKKPPRSMHCMMYLMNGLLQTQQATTLWCRWKGMGFLDKARKRLDWHCARMPKVEDLAEEGPAEDHAVDDQTASLVCHKTLAPPSSFGAAPGAHDDLGSLLRVLLLAAEDDSAAAYAW